MLKKPKYNKNNHRINIQRCKKKFILYGYIIFSFFPKSNLWKNEVYFSFLFIFICLYKTELCVRIKKVCFKKITPSYSESKGLKKVS